MTKSFENFRSEILQTGLNELCLILHSIEDCTYVVQLHARHTRNCSGLRINHSAGRVA